MITANDFQSYLGPGDKNLPNSEVTGYQPVSRIGEVVMNAFVDAYEFSTLTYDQLSRRQMLNYAHVDAAMTPDELAAVDNEILELKPHFHGELAARAARAPPAPHPHPCLPQSGRRCSRGLNCSLKVCKTHTASNHPI